MDLKKITKPETMRGFFGRARAVFDSGAWVMLIIGLVLFSLRVQFEPGGWINLPVMFTVFQTAGLMFAVFGLQLIASMLFWPDIRLNILLTHVKEGNVSAGIVILGLLIFNGLSSIAMILWITSALGAGVIGAS